MNINELSPILKKVFPEHDSFSIKMTKSDITSWDSIGHLNLIVEIEDAFNVIFEQEEIEHLNSIEMLIELLNKKMHAR